ncbi:hypothetical protein DES53_106138 [Roseimicrobium gellanilyticum]|uniref:Uncharacterized protein n=1 Tax=Roseimicrobium gellanilyticum TaxID=748857 RepID=A0A366HI91_9BACT|nr:hypothetical protein [Roseimicrobium gellanilyticum]RBP42431.1 hypothetical protein DES53_106138 [Roseimicrobium gellanilyticum]
MKLFSKSFWSKRSAPAKTSPTPEPKQEPTPAPVDISKLHGKAKAAAILNERMRTADARAALERAEASTKAEKQEQARTKLNEHVVKQGQLSTKRARESYFRLHRADIDTAIRESGQNSNTWYATFLA